MDYWIEKMLDDCLALERKYNLVYNEFIDALENVKCFPINEGSEIVNKYHRKWDAYNEIIKKLQYLYSDKNLEILDKNDTYAEVHKKIEAHKSKIQRDS